MMLGTLLCVGLASRALAESAACAGAGGSRRYDSSSFSKLGVCLKTEGVDVSDGSCAPCLVGAEWDAMRQELGYLHSNGTRDGLTLELADSAGSQLLSSVARILLEEMMAYTNVTVAVTSDAEDVGARVGLGCSTIALEWWGTSTTRLPAYAEWVENRGLATSKYLELVIRERLFVNEVAVSGAAYAPLYLDHYRSLRDNPLAIAALPAVGTWAVNTATEDRCSAASKPSWWKNSSCSANRYAPPACRGAHSATCAEWYGVRPERSSSRFEGQVAANGINATATYVGAEGIAAVVQDAVSRNVPILFYGSEPSALLSMHPTVQEVHFPAVTAWCDTGAAVDPDLSEATCNVPDDFVQSVINTQRYRADADLAHFFDAFEMRNARMTELLTLDRRGGGSLTTEEAACSWVKEHVDEWQLWIFNSQEMVACGSNSVLSPMTLLCEVCAAGSVVTVTDENPTPPTPDLGRSELSSLVSCVKCGKGLYYDMITVSCLLCDSESYQELEGQSECLSCPEGTSRLDATADEYDSAVASAGSKSSCVCKTGFYSSVWNTSLTASSKSSGLDGEWGVAGVICHECPEGATCGGSLLAPQNQNRFWGNDRHPDRFYSCGAQCLESYECAAGYEGVMCSLISQSRSHFMVAGVDMYECPRTARSKYALTAGLLVFVAWFWYVVNYVALPRFMSFEIFLTHAQECAIIARYNPTGWPSAMNYVGPFFELLLFDIDIVPPSCVYSWMPHNGLALQIALLFAGVFSFVPVLGKVAYRLATDRTYRSRTAVGASFEFSNGEHGESFSKSVSGLCTLIAVQYPTITYNALDVLRCQSIRGSRERVMTFDPNYACGSALQKSLLASGVLIFVLISLGIPLCLLFTIWYEYTVNGGVHAPYMLARWGWAYSEYKSPLHWWRVLSYTGMIALCASATLIDDEWQQVSLTCLICSVQLTLIFAYRPHVHKADLKLEVAGCVYTLMFTVSVVPAWSSSASSRYSNAWNLYIYASTALLLGWACYGSHRDNQHAWRYTKAVDTVRKRLFGIEKLSTRKQAQHAVQGLQHVTNHAIHTARVTGKRITSGRTLPGLNSIHSHHTEDQDESEERANFLEEQRLSARREQLEAVEEFTNTINKDDLFYWTKDPVRTDQDFELFSKISSCTHRFVADTCPTSCFSVESRAQYYRRLVEMNPGILNFVAEELSPDERKIYFGTLCRLEKVSRLKNSHRSYRDMVCEQDHSSVLFYLLGAPTEEVKNFRVLMEQIQHSSHRLSRKYYKHQLGVELRQKMLPGFARVEERGLMRRNSTPREIHRSQYTGNLAATKTPKESQKFHSDVLRQLFNSRERDALVRVSYLKMLIEAEEEANLPGAHRRCRGSPFPLRAEDRYFQGPSFSDIVTFEGGSENDEALLEEGKSEKKTQRSARSPKRRAERQELRKMAPFGTGKDRYRRKASNSEEAVWPALCTDPGTAAFSRYTCSIA